MLTLTSWVQTDTRQPNNPYQQTREVMVGQGGDGSSGYTSFYWNQVPNPPNSGLLGAFPVMPTWLQVLVAGLAIAATGGTAYGVTRYLKHRS